MENNPETVPEMTPERAELIKNTLLFLYADQIGVNRKDLNISIRCGKPDNTTEKSP